MWGLGDGKVKGRGGRGEGGGERGEGRGERVEGGLNAKHKVAQWVWVWNIHTSSKESSCWRTSDFS